MKRSQLEQIIQEELVHILQERKKKKKKAKYTSAGTVPRKRGRTMTPAQIQKRETLGIKILAAIKSGGDENPLRKKFKEWAQQNDHPINSEEKMKSYAWAMASDFAIEGKPFPPPFKKKKQEEKPENKNKKSKSASPKSKKQSNSDTELEKELEKFRSDLEKNTQNISKELEKNRIN